MSLWHITSYLRRRWRSRGFGVHSPFAFRFLCDVVADRDAYYAYADIRREGRRRGASARQIRLARLLVRLACRTSIKRAVVLGPADSLADFALGLCGSLPVSHSADDISENTLVVINGRSLQEPEKLTGEGNILVFCDMPDQASEYQSLTSAMDHGMVFTDRRAAIVVAMKYLPRQDFDIYL